MNKAYSRRHWKNYPDDSTPVDEVNLGEGDRALDIIDDRVIELDATKATKVEVSTMISDVSFDDATGIFTFTRKNGAVITLNTNLEKLAVNFTYDAQNERLVITLDDGTVQYVDMSALITQYEFVDSDTIVFTLGTDGKVTADIKNGSVTEEKLQPNYLADIKVEVGKAQTASANAASSASAAAASETSVANNAQLAQTAATNAGNAQTAAETAQSAAEDAQGAAEAAQAAAEDAKADAETAESNAQRHASNASASQTAANTSEQNAQTYADRAQSYAVGTNGTVRPTDTTDNAKAYYEQAKYYYEQALAISQTLSGILQPKGTITFAQLPGLLDAEAGWMYNISDAFTTDARFKEGAGIPVSAGSNIYKTVDNQWDILAGSPVTGIKGSAESTYRTGLVNITPANLGINLDDFLRIDGNNTLEVVSDCDTFGAGIGLISSATLHNPFGTNSGFLVSPGKPSANTFRAVQLCFSLSKIKYRFVGILMIPEGETSYFWENTWYDLINNQAPEFTEASTRSNIASGETIAILFGKIKKWFSDLKTVAFTGSYNDLNDQPSIPTKTSDLTNDSQFLASTGDSKDVVTTFTSGDDMNPSAYTDVALLASGETHASIFAKLSNMFKNIRYLYKMLGTTDISSIGDGTATGAISALNSNLPKKLSAKRVEFIQPVNAGNDYAWSLLGITSAANVNYNDLFCIIIEGARPKTTWNAIPITYYNSNENVWGMHNSGSENDNLIIDFLVFYYV